jgi:hypothetical protein
MEDDLIALLKPRQVQSWDCRILVESVGALPLVTFTRKLVGGKWLTDIPQWLLDLEKQKLLILHVRAESMVYAGSP